MSNKILGQAEIRINGQYYDTKEGATLTVGGKKNTAQQVGLGTYYTQTSAPAKLECEVPHSEGMSLRALQEATEALVTFTADTGQTYILRNAFQTGDVSVKDGADGGLVALVFESAAAEEMK